MRALKAASPLATDRFPSVAELSSSLQEAVGLGDRYLLFSRNGTFWLNRLKQRCGGLRRDKVLTFISHGSTICQGDQAYVSDRFDIDRGFDGAGRPRYHQGVCILGPFETGGPEQAALLLESVR